MALFKKNFVFSTKTASFPSGTHMYTLCKHLGHVKSLIKTSNPNCCRFGALLFFSILSFPINGYFFYRCLRFLHFTSNTQNRHAANYPAIFAQHHNYYYYCYFYAYNKNLEGESGQNKFFFYDCCTHRERPVRGRTAAVVFEGRPFPPITRPNNTRRVVENEFR